MGKSKVRNLTSFWATTLITGTVIGVVSVNNLSAAPAGPPGGLDVSEQNLDGNGYIRVHEQGVVPVTDNGGALSVDDNGGSLSVDDFGGALSVDDNGTSLSVDDGGGVLTVDGTVNVAQPVTVNGTVSVVEPVTVDGLVGIDGPVEVSGSVSVENGGFMLTEEAGAFSATAGWGESTPPQIPGSLDNITLVNLYTNNIPAAIVFTFEDDMVATFFAQPGAPVNATLTHPILADRFFLRCFSTTTLCEGGYSVSGYRLPD